MDKAPKLRYRSDGTKVKTLNKSTQMPVLTEADERSEEWD